MTSERTPMRLVLILLLCLTGPGLALAQDGIRVATFNASLSRKGAGVLLHDLRKGTSAQIRAVVEIIQRTRPDILFLNELDHDADGAALFALRDLLKHDGEGVGGIDYPHLFTAAVNTGVDTGRDLDRDGKTGGPGDALGWGRFPGQYGMAVLSRFPIGAPRTFRDLAWADMPDALLPTAFYGADAGLLRLSSKSHWDVPVTLPDGRILHLLGAHPTPPVFDGPEDRNGRRNHDEIRFWSDYLSGAGWMTDDTGRSGAISAEALVVVLGDLNLDPEDGDGRRGAMRALLAHPRLQDPTPRAEGAAEAAARQGGANARHGGEAALDTADWRDTRGPGNLRVDFVLPDRRFQVLDAGVFWPARADPLHRLVKGKRPVSSDHRLVWVDIR